MKKRNVTGLFLSLLCLGASPMNAQEGYYYNEPYFMNGDGCCEPSCCDQSYWAFQADFLYWSTDFNNIAAIDATVVTGTPADVTIQISHPRQKWDPGVRLTAGWMGCNNWDLFGSWTYFYNSNTNNRTPFALQIDTDTLPTDGSTQFIFRYNAADLGLSTPIALTPCLEIHPYIGVHSIWTEADSRLNILVGIPEEDVFALGITMRNRSWGVGPMMGINTLWGNWCGWSLLGNVNGALIYGQQRAKLDVGVEIDSEAIVNVDLFADDHWLLMSTVQMQAGLSYLGCFCNHNFRFNALWECNILNQVDNILIFDRSINMQGLTLSFQYLY